MKILCAGPTSIDDEVLNEMSKSAMNPDLDPKYESYHRKVEEKYSRLLNTKSTSFFMLGEAIICLEASICSLMEKGEKVLVIYNGFFGEGFSEYVENFGGIAYKFKSDFRKGIDVKKLESFLKENNDFSIATLVHCETPSGLTNNIKEICSLLKRYNILTIVDSVSAIGGEYINFDESNADIMIGGSQKCLSAPVGIGMITLSDKAKEKISTRKTKVPSYYLNFENYYNFKGAPFPYTMNENLIYALDKALDLALEKDFAGLHKKYASITREVFLNCNFELYPKDSFSNTVTTIITPKGITSEALLEKMREKNIAISKGVGDLKDKVFRIGHMGNNISYENFLELFEKLDHSFEELNIKLTSSLRDGFVKLYKAYK